MKHDLIYVNLLSKNHEKLISFYNDVVGLSPTEPDADPATEHWYGYDTGHTSFAIEPMSNRDSYDFDYEKGNPVLIQFKAQSLEHLTEWTERLEKAGVTIGQRIVKKEYGTFTTFVDPDGNVLEILYSDSHQS